MLKHTTSSLEDIAADPALDADDFEAAEDVCTSDNLILLARYLAVEIQNHTDSYFEPCGAVESDSTRGSVRFFFHTTKCQRETQD